MSREEIRQLLGGYATNTLTESERKALFEAALDDQELFDALQEEQALKELLDDPVSRNQIRVALEQTAAGKVRSWWSQRWVWGATSAVAATILVVAVVQHNRPMATSEPVEVAVNQSPAAPAAEPTESAETRSRENQPKAAERAKSSPAAPSAAPAPKEEIAAAKTAQTQRAEVQPLAQADAAQEVRQQTRGSIEARVMKQSAPAVSGFAANIQAPLRYSLVRREADGTDSPVTPNTELKPGDAIRVNVSSSVSGNLSLDRLNRSGQWEILVPGFAAAANTQYVIPESPVAVQEMPQQFRLSLTRSDAGPAATMEIMIPAAKN